MGAALGGIDMIGQLGAARAGGRAAAVLGCVLLAAACAVDDATTASPSGSVVPSATASATTGPTAGAPSAVPVTASPVPSPAGPIRVVQPSDGSTVARAFEVRGTAVAYEGTLIWGLYPGSGTTGTAVVTGIASAGATAPAAFRFTVTAPRAGSYTLAVYQESAKDGVPTDAVTRRLTVR